MKREIKFRAWVDNKYMVEVSSLSFWKNSDGEYYSKSKCTGWFGANNQVDFSLKDTPLMQYTGLKDRNGADIYEGDELACYIDGKQVGAIDEVRFKNGAFWLLRRNIPMCYWEAQQNAEFQVTGNIHQQP